MNKEKKIIIFGLVTVSIILLGIGISGCIQQNPNITGKGLIVTLSTDKTLYEVGDNVSIVISIFNDANTSAHLSFSSIYRADFEVLNETGDQIYQWSKNIELSMTEGWENLTLSSGETVDILKEKWNQKDNEGNQLPLGNYTIRAWISIEPVLYSDIVTIQIQ